MVSGDDVLVGPSADPERPLKQAWDLVTALRAELDLQVTGPPDTLQDHLKAGVGQAAPSRTTTEKGKTMADKRTATDTWCPQRGGDHDWIRWSGKQRCRTCGYTKSGQ